MALSRTENSDGTPAGPSSPTVIKQHIDVPALYPALSKHSVLGARWGDCCLLDVEYLRWFQRHCHVNNLEVTKRSFTLDECEHRESSCESVLRCLLAKSVRNEDKSHSSSVNAGSKDCDPYQVLISTLIDTHSAYHKGEIQY